MKKSNIILLALVLVVCGTFVSLAVALRVKFDHKDYKIAQAFDTEFEDVAAGAFSVIEAENLDGIEINQGDRDSIGLPTRPEKRPLYKVVGDTLKLTPGRGPGNDNIRLTVHDLKGLYIHRVNSCHVYNIQGDSLYTLVDGGNDISIEGGVVGSFRLQLSGGGIGVDHITCKTLSLYADSVSRVSLKNCMIECVRGRWDGREQVEMDGGTLSFIQKIERIQ
ncbi:DUF2807 domain-containing protein [Dinghuibacter silviterrae]|uniref:Putative auto-transporter adhesin head GIN domain-containing protein n=1 Tax=Dinghuibacter silviterrae TaxID=1539049 RepID=A0A4R8DP17_9BACT|nr:DUF2807 domain-containing protein [Dinghuibacter silviterrae]TDW99164.1 hypothetical protein EDB95_0172 [Dinghuibacter silviterrae]